MAKCVPSVIQVADPPPRKGYPMADVSKESWFWGVGDLSLNEVWYGFYCVQE